MFYHIDACEHRHILRRKKVVRKPRQHLCPLYFRLEERQDSPHPVSKNLPDLRHMFILHLHTIAYKLYGIRTHLDLPQNIYHIQS